MRLRTVLLRTLLATALAGAALVAVPGALHTNLEPISETCPTCVNP